MQRLLSDKKFAWCRGIRPVRVNPPAARSPRVWPNLCCSDGPTVDLHEADHRLSGARSGTVSLCGRPRFRSGRRAALTLGYDDEEAVDAEFSSRRAGDELQIDSSGHSPRI